jgi:hypothetical protein
LARILYGRAFERKLFPLSFARLSEVLALEGLADLRGIWTVGAGSPSRLVSRSLGGRFGHQTFPIAKWLGGIVCAAGGLIVALGHGKSPFWIKIASASQVPMIGAISVIRR